MNNMTREEQILNGFTEMMRGFWNNQNLKASNFETPCKQEPCKDDAISRQEVVGYLCTHCPDNAECFKDCDDIKIIKIFPPVTLQPKEGYWIDADGDNAICGCCNRLNHLYGTYCKYCGAKMHEP